MPGTSPSITNSKSLGNRPWELPGRYAPADAKPAAAMSAIWTRRRTIRDVAERNWEPIRFIAKTPLPKSTRFARALQKDGAGRRVREQNRVDGLKLLFDDGSWVLMRPSGTEPVVRFYAESSSTSDLDKLLEYGRQWITEA